MVLSSLHKRPWLLLLPGLALLEVIRLAACVTGGPTPLPVPTPFPPLEPFEATVAAIMRTIPTGTPDYNMPDGKGPDKQRDDVYYKAGRTVVAEHPITPGPTWIPVPYLTPLEPTPQVAGAGV